MEKNTCCCEKTKSRSEKEYKDLINRLNRIEGQIRGHHLLVVGIEGGAPGNAGLQLLVQVAGGDQLDLRVAQDAIEVD